MGESIRRDLAFFHDGLKRAQSILDSFSAVFSTKVDCVVRDLDTLSSLTETLVVKDDTPIAALVNGEIGKWQQVIDRCREQAQKQIKGREFQQKFEKVPLTIVFGIVKAGKSTLGNFIHGRAFRAAPFDNAYSSGEIPKTKIVVEEKGRCDASEKEEFDENSIESTCSAQYFTLPGLAWVDTPGIGAIEKRKIDIQPLANIARKYVQYADLVVFLANSTNPGVQEDISGYKELYENGKKALVVITRSDTVRSSVENGRVVKRQIPKDQATRRLQEESLRNAMAGAGVPREFCDAVSVSTQLAERAIAADDDALWEGGNIGELYRKIISVIGNEQILELKKAAPRKLWNQTVETIVGNEKAPDSLVALSADLARVHASIKERYDALSPDGELVATVVEDVVNEMRRPIRCHVDRIASEAQGDNVVFGVDALGAEIQNDLVEVLDVHVKSIVGEFRKDVLGTFSANGIESSAQRRVETHTYAVEVPEIVERDPDGFFENFFHFFGKSYHKVVVNEEKRSVAIDLGIDPAQAKAQLLTDLETALVSHVKGELEKLRTLFFGATLSRIAQLEESVSNLSGRLLSCRFDAQSH